jgi:hypothetical protein
MLRRLIDRLLGMTGRAARPDLSRYDGTDAPQPGPATVKRPDLKVIPGGRQITSPSAKASHDAGRIRRAG